MLLPPQITSDDQCGGADCKILGMPGGTTNGPSLFQNDYHGIWKPQKNSNLFRNI